MLFNAIVAGAFYLGARGLGIANLIPCVYPPYAGAIIGSILTVAIDVALLPRIGVAYLAWCVAALGCLSAAAFWMGSYRWSPIGYGRGGPDLVSAFRVTQSDRPPYMTSPRQVIVAIEGTPIEIEPILLPGLHPPCQWNSDHGGAIDDRSSCDIAYEPPAGSAYDVLRLLVRPACGLPERAAKINVSIAP